MLSTKYLGLDLVSPVIAGSSGLTASTKQIKKMEEAGAGAIVLKSLFEEQIHNVSEHLESYGTDYPEAMDYIRAYTRSNSLERYLELIHESKKTVKLPIIASVSCISDVEWTDFSKKIEEAGADALELNLFYLPTDKFKTGTSYEQRYYSLLEKVKQVVKIPVSVKLGFNFTNILNLVQELYSRKANGVVLFNRFYEPDIDIDKMELIAGSVFSVPSDLRLVLRSVALVSASIPGIDISASTGIHDGNGAVKQLLAGASSVQITSALYQNGAGQITKVNDFIRSWMKKKSFTSVDQFKGKLNYANISNPEVYERSQFMKYFSNYSNE